MWGPRITLIYFYLISAISIVLLVIGTYNIISFGINSLLYEKYPLEHGSITDRCNFSDPYSPYGATDLKLESTASVSAEERVVREQRCLQSLDEERERHRVNDLKNSTAFTLIGAILFGLHFPSALKRANEDVPSRKSLK